MTYAKPKKYTGFFFILIIAGLLVFVWGYWLWHSSSQALGNLGNVNYRSIPERITSLDVQWDSLPEDLQRFTSNPEGDVPLGLRHRHAKLSAALAETSQFILALLDSSIVQKNRHAHMLHISMLGQLLEAQSQLQELRRITLLIAETPKISTNEEEIAALSARAKESLNHAHEATNAALALFSNSLGEEMAFLEKRKRESINYLVIGLSVSLMTFGLMAYRFGYVRASRGSLVSSKGAKGPDTKN